MTAHLIVLDAMTVFVMVYREECIFTTIRKIAHTKSFLIRIHFVVQ
jgi:hypothetical protein